MIIEKMKGNLFTLFCLTSLSVSAQLTVRDSAFKEPILLEEVVVKARSKNIDSRGLGNMRINIRQLQLSPLFFGERDVIKTLQFLPGVSAGMEGSSRLNIRGGTNDQTLYLMDDVPVYNQNHTFGLFSIFNSDALRSVDLYKGGIPAPYGDKLSGVVSVDLKEGDFKKYHHSASLGILAGSIASEGPIVEDRLSYLITGRRSFLDLLYNGFMELSGEGSGGNAMISFYDLNGKLAWKINDKNNLTWQLYSGYDDLYGMNHEKDDFTKEKYKEKYGYGWNTFMTSLRSKSQLSANLSLSGKIYYTSLNNFNYYRNKQEAPGFSQKMENGNSSLLTEIGGGISFTHQIKHDHTVYYGTEGAYQLYTPDYTFRLVDRKQIEYNTDRLKLFKASAYLYDELKYKQWLFSLGFRASLYDNREVRKFVWEPRIKANTFVNEKNKLMLAYDRMFQPIHTVNEMDYNSKTDYWIPFQENILPRSDQFSIGWKNYTNSNFSFSLEGYYKSMWNLLLIKDLEYYLDSHTDYEQGKGSSAGMELMAEYSGNRISAWASYTLSKSRRSFGSKTYPFKYDTPHDLSVFAGYIVRKKPKNRHTFSIQLQYNTGYPYYVPEITYPGMGLPTLPSGYSEADQIFSVDYIPQYPNIRLNDYFRLDANYTIEKELKHGSLTWQFSLLNVTNRENPYAVYRKNGKYKAFILIPMMPSISIKRSF